MSTPFDVRRWAEQAGIHTTGGFSVVAECVTLDELQRFADIAIATAAKHWQRAHAITALEALENAQDQLAKPYSTEASKAITALRAALAESEQNCWCHKCNEGKTVNGVPFSMTRMILCPDCGNKRCPHASDHRLACTNSNDSGQLGSVYTAPPQHKPLTEEEILEAVREADLDWQAGWTLDEHEPNRFTTLARAIEQAHGIKGKA